MKQVRLRKGKEESLKRFHPWVFSGAIAQIDEGKQHQPLSEPGKRRYPCTMHNEQCTGLHPSGLHPLRPHV